LSRLPKGAICVHFLFGDIHRQGVPEDAALTNPIVAGSPSVDLQTVRFAARIVKRC
jgi:hypothetical protein